MLKTAPEIKHRSKMVSISMAHARVLAGIQDVENSYFFIEGQSRKNERKTDGMLHANWLLQVLPLPSESTKAVNRPPLNWKRKKISSLLGTKVDIQRNDKGKGKIVINFGNDKEFNDIMIYSGTLIHKNFSRALFVFLFAFMVCVDVKAQHSLPLLNQTKWNGAGQFKLCGPQKEILSV